MSRIKTTEIIKPGGAYIFYNFCPPMSLVEKLVTYEIVFIFALLTEV